jgi:prepilin-type N-terminal cleavage/methylation domain-containing protein
MRHRELEADEGFTLIELAVTVVVMTIVLGALTMGVVTLLRTTGVTTDRLVGSHDAQLLTEWITTDVQSAASTPNLTSTTKPGCADDASLPASGINVAQMTWTDRSTGLVYHAAYRTEQINAGPPAVWYLVRYFCQEGQPSTHFAVIRGLKDGSVCPSGVPGTPPEAACVLTATWPRFDLQIVTVANAQSYTFTATATGRTAISGTDVAGPIVVSAVAYNTDSSGNAGLINRVVVTFDEALKPNDSLPVGEWTLQNAPNGVVVTNATAANRTVTLTLGGGTGSPDTLGSTFKIDLQAGSSVQDGLGNRAPAFTGKTVVDGMAPVIVSATTSDNDVDAKIDHINLTMSEPIFDNTLDNNLFTVTAPPAWGGTRLPVITASKTGAPTSATATLALDDTSFPQDTAATGFTVAMAASPNSVRDQSATHNFGAWAATPVDDGIPPELLSIKSHASAAGKLDQIIVDFSESLQPSTDTGLWHLSIPAGWITPPTVNNVLVNGSQVTLTINPASVRATPDTAAAGLTATLDPSATTGIRDAAGNPATFISKSVTDAMAPLLTSVAFSGGTQPGLFETGDRLVATFSEALASPATTTVAVTLDQPVGAATATIDIPGLTNGAIDTLSSSYFVSDGSRAQWPAATVVRFNNTITVTLTGACMGTVTDPTCANLTVGGFVDTPLDLSTTIVDRAIPTPNAALDVTLNIRWF